MKKKKKPQSKMPSVRPTDALEVDFMEQQQRALRQQQVISAFFEITDKLHKRTTEAYLDTLKALGADPTQGGVVVRDLTVNCSAEGGTGIRIETKGEK